MRRRLPNVLLSLPLAAALSDADATANANARGRRDGTGSMASVYACYEEGMMLKQVAFCEKCGWSGDLAEQCPNCGADDKFILVYQIKKEYLERAKQCWHVSLGPGWEDRLSRNIALALQEMAEGGLTSWHPSELDRMPQEAKEPAGD